MIVKKYSNRRLYDTEASRYITLEELAERIRAGADVQVVDAKSGADLTQATLAQIILESRGAAKLLPVSLLIQLIRMGDDALAEFFGKYMSWALEVYVQVRRGAQAAAPYNPFATSPLQATEVLARLFGTMPWGTPPPPPSSAAPVPAPEPHAAREPAPPSEPVHEPAPAPAAAREDEVAELRRELEELKKAVRDKG